MSERHSSPPIDTVAKPVPLGGGGRVARHVAAARDDLAVERDLHERPAAGSSSLAAGGLAAERRRRGRGRAPRRPSAAERAELRVDRLASVALDLGEQHGPAITRRARRAEHRRDRDPGPQAQPRAQCPSHPPDRLERRDSPPPRLASQISDEHVDDVVSTSVV